MKKIMFSKRYGLEQATIAGDKTMTRREVRLPLIAGLEDIREADMEVQADGSLCAVFRGYMDGEPYTICKVKPQYQVGEVVAIGQTYEDVANNFYGGDEMFRLGFIRQIEEAHELLKEDIKGWRNKMYVRAEFMPHQIRIANIRVERIRDISKEDCMKEGIEKCSRRIMRGYYGFSDNNIEDGLHVFPTPQQAFAELMKRTCGSRVWNKNLWTFVYEYSLVK